MSTREELAYAESVRALDHQARALDELRSRTGLLLAAASIVASFLGAQALDGSDLDALASLGLLAFLAVIALSIPILMPRSEWLFAMSAKVLFTHPDWVEIERAGGVTAMQRHLAEAMEVNWDANKLKLDLLFRRFTFAAGALGAEVVFWTLKLA
jgi:hypothetical protein